MALATTAAGTSLTRSVSEPWRAGLVIPEGVHSLGQLEGGDVLVGTTAGGEEVRRRVGGPGVDAPGEIAGEERGRRRRERDGVLPEVDGHLPVGDREDRAAQAGDAGNGLGEE